MLGVEDFKNVIATREQDTEHKVFQFGDVELSIGGNQPYVSVDNDDYALTDGSFSQLAKILDVPVPYARKMPNHLLEYTFNYLMKDKRSSYIGGLFEQGRMRSIMGPNDPYVSTNEAFNQIVANLGDDYDLRYPSVSDVSASFSILPAQYRESVDGANLFGGLRVIYSDSWFKHPSVDAYIWRELCSNGMISELESRKFRVAKSSHDDILRQIDDFATLSIDKIPELFENFNNLLGESVADYAKMIQSICLEHHLSNKVRDRLMLWAGHPQFLETISNSRIENMHDIVNLITYVGSHDLELSDDIRALLLSIGGSVTNSHEDRCNSCGSVV